MAKIHIALVGGQPAPVYKGIIDEQPDKVVLVYSKDSLEQANSVEKLACRKIDTLKCDKVQMDTVSIAEMKEKIEEIAGNLDKEAQVTINLSGGPKVWSILFYDRFMKIARCICLDQNDNKFDFSSRQATKIKAKLDISDTLELNNITSIGMRLSDYTKEDFQAVQTVREMRKLSVANFNKLMKQTEDRPEIKYWYIDAWNYLSWDKDSNTFTMSISNKWSKKTKDICSPNVKKVVLNTGWFELEVAKLLSEWVQPQHIAMNCKLRSSKNIDGPILNEIDIIIEIKGKLLFVECKTQIKDATDIDKFHNAVRTYGGLSAKGIFFTDAVMRGQAKAKCDLAGIPTFSMQEIKKTGNEGKKELFGKLRELIGGLNIR